MKLVEKLSWWVIPTFCILAAAEFAARAAITHFGNPLDQARRVLWVDPYLGWRQRENLSTSFLGKPLHTDSFGFRTANPLRTNAYDAWVLGPSSAFGWGVADAEAYPALLGKALSASVLNAGEIGYSTFQGVRLLGQLTSTLPAPRTIIFSYGINDLDRNRFYFQSGRTDREELTHGDRAFTAHVLNFFVRFSFTSLAFKLRGALSIMSLSRQHGPASLSIRVPMADLRSNIGVLAAESAKIGARPVFMTTAFHLSGPLFSQTDLSSYKKGRQFYEKGNLGSAEHIFRKITAGDFANEAYGYLSAIAAARNNYREAREFARLAHAKEPERIRREVTLLNQTIRRAAREAGADILELGDLVGEDKDFVDPVHFSKRGNERIAHAIVELMNSAPKKNGTQRKR